MNGGQTCTGRVKVALVKGDRAQDWSQVGDMARENGRGVENTRYVEIDVWDMSSFQGSSIVFKGDFKAVLMTEHRTDGLYKQSLPYTCLSYPFNPQTLSSRPSNILTTLVDHRSRT